MGREVGEVQVAEGPGGLILTQGLPSFCSQPLFPSGEGSEMKTPFSWTNGNTSRKYRHATRC